MKKKEIIDAEFKAVETEAVEEVAENQPMSLSDIADKGIIIYEPKNGSGVSYQTIGDVTIKELSYYRRAFEKIEEALWSTNTHQATDETDANA